MDADIFVSGKKKLRIQNYPDSCGRGLSVTEHEYMQINGSRIYVNESDGVIGPKLCVLVSLVTWFHGFRGVIGCVVSWFHRFLGFLGFVVS